MSFKKIIIQGAFTLVLALGLFFVGSNNGVEKSEAAMTIDLRPQSFEMVAVREPISKVSFENDEFFAN